MPTTLRVPRPLHEPPLLDYTRPNPPICPRHALLINPFYPKDPHASFGTHLLTPTLALPSVAAPAPRTGSPAILSHYRQPHRHARLSQPLRLLLPLHRRPFHALPDARPATNHH